MFLRKFRETGPDVVILIFFVSLLVWGGSFSHPLISTSSGYDIRPMPFFALLLKLNMLKPVISVLFTFILVLFISFLLVSFNTADFFMGQRTFMPALFYILLSGLSPRIQILNPALPAVIFLIMALRRIMDSYQVRGTAYSFFSAGILISAGSMFYASLIWFGLLLIIGIAILRTGNFKEMIISLLGLITPWFLFFGILYVSGKDISLWLSDILFNLFDRDGQVTLSAYTIAGLAVFGFVLIISTGNLLASVGAKKVKSRKTFTLLIWIFLISAGIFLIFHSVSDEIIWIAGVPVSYFLSHYFVYARKNFFPRTFFSALFIAIALIQIMNLTLQR